MPAPAVGPGPDQGERLEERVVVARRARRACPGAGQAGAGHVSPGRVVIPHGDGRLPARLTARADVEYRDAVPGRGVAPRGPGRRLDGVGGGARIAAGRALVGHGLVGHGRGRPGKDPGRPGKRRRRARRAIGVIAATAGAEDQVHGALAGVEHAAVHRGHRAGPAGVRRRAVQGVRARRRVEAANGEGPLVPVVVPGQHEVNLVGVEQRQPLPPDAQVGPAARGRRRARALVQLHDDPVDGGVGAGGRQGRLEPPGLRAAGVAAS